MASNKLVVSSKARTDLRKIYDYIKESLFDKQAADKQSASFRAGFKQVCQLPNACPKYKDYRKLVVKNYLVFYKFNQDEKTIIVHHVVYGAMDYDRFL